MFFQSAFSVVAMALATARSVVAAAIDVNAGSPFYLKSESLDGQAQFNNLYVYAYHSGAGLNDAMLSANKSMGNPATQVPGSLDSNTNSYFSVYVHYDPNMPYQLLPTSQPGPTSGLNTVAINVGIAAPTVTNAFYLSNNHLDWTNAAESQANTFQGWAACETTRVVHQQNIKVTQLFWRATAAYNKALAGGTCSNINLVTENAPAV